MTQSLRCSASKNIKACFPPVNLFLKDIPFYSIQVTITDDTNFLCKLGWFRIYSPTRCYTCFPLFKALFILFVSNVSLWLFIVFSWLLFLSSFTRCIIKWRWHWDFLIIRFRFVLAFFDGKNFKWIPQWNSVILLMVQFGFLVSTDFFNWCKIFCVVVNFMSIYLLNW